MKAISNIGNLMNLPKTAILAEELTGIYSTPTPKGWPEPKKVN